MEQINAGFARRLDQDDVPPVSRKKTHSLEKRKEARLFPFFISDVTHRPEGWKGSTRFSRKPSGRFA